MIDIAQLTSLFYQYGPISVLLAVLIFVFVYMFRVIMDEDKSALWRARVSYALYKISGQREHEKKYISNNINSRINLARRALHFGKSALPQSLGVEWAENQPASVYTLKDVDFIVRLDPSECQERNITKLATAVVCRTALLGTRHLITTPLRESLDLNLVRNLLQGVGDQAVIDWFLKHEYVPAVQDPAIDTWNREIVEVDERGLFTRILLVELDAFSKRIAGLAPRPFMMGEIEELVHFLYRIATKKVGQKVPLTYVKAYIAVGVILVAKTDTILLEGLEPYVKCMNYHVQNRLDAVYVIVFDKELLQDTDEEAYRQFVQLTNALDQQILNSSLVAKDFSVRYSCLDQAGRRRKAICTRYLIKNQ